MASEAIHTPDTISALACLVGSLAPLIGFGPEIRALIGDEDWKKLGAAAQTAHKVLSTARENANG